MKECKKYGLKPARTPQQHPLLAGVVYVVDEHGKGYAYIHFSDAFVAAVGAEMAEGLRPDAQGYLKALYVAHTRTWRIYAMYADVEAGALLWESLERPAWLTKIRRDPHGPTPRHPRP